MPCGFLWLSEGLHALPVMVSFGRTRPFSAPLEIVSLSGWCCWLRDHTWEASCVCVCVCGCAWALHTSICLKLVGSLGLPSLQREGQLPPPSGSRGKRKRVQPSHLHFLLVPSGSSSSSSSYRERAAPSVGQASSSLSW